MSDSIQTVSTAQLRVLKALQLGDVQFTVDPLSGVLEIYNDHDPGDPAYFIRFSDDEQDKLRDWLNALEGVGTTHCIVPVEPPGEVWSKMKRTFSEYRTLIVCADTEDEAAALADVAALDLYRDALAASKPPEKEVLRARILAEPDCDVECGAPPKPQGDGRDL